VISSAPPSASFLNFWQLNPGANTGRNKKIKHAPERYDLQLSDAPRNIKNGEELVSLRSD
jgi:hypothetical protein